MGKITIGSQPPAISTGAAKSRIDLARVTSKPTPRRIVVSRNNVRAGIGFASAPYAEWMKKLNQRKIRWICREAGKEELSICKIARIQKITPRHVRRVYEKYRGVKKPCLLPCGRKLKPFSEEEISVVLTLREEHLICAVNLEKLLDEVGYHIPHNRIHKILREFGLARPEPNKQKRRKPWIRYERDHSNSLWPCEALARVVVGPSFMLNECTLIGSNETVRR